MPGVDASLGDRDPVQGAVELAVAAAVEAVALVFAGAGVEWGDAGVASQLGVGSEAGDRADLAEQLRGAQGPAAGKLEQPWRERLRARPQFALELADRAGQAAATSEQVAGGPHLRCLLSAGELPCDPIDPDGAVERAQRHRQGRVELVQVPAQPLLARRRSATRSSRWSTEQLQLPQRLLAGTRTVQ